MINKYIQYEVYIHDKVQLVVTVNLFIKLSRPALVPYVTWLHDSFIIQYTIIPLNFPINQLLYFMTSNNDANISYLSLQLLNL